MKRRRHKARDAARHKPRRREPPIAEQVALEDELYDELREIPWRERGAIVRRIADQPGELHDLVADLREMTPERRAAVVEVWRSGV